MVSKLKQIRAGVIAKRADRNMQKAWTFQARSDRNYNIWRNMSAATMASSSDRAAALNASYRQQTRANNHKKRAERQYAKASKLMWY